MLWFLRDYPLAAVLLRAATLACQSLLIGGMFFCSCILSSKQSQNIFFAKARRLLWRAALGLIAAQVAFITLDSAMLLGTSTLRWVDLFTASYVLAGVLSIVTAGAFLLCLYFISSRYSPRWLGFALPLLASSVWTSHAASRLEDRALLVILTALHQLATAVWIASLPYLWVFLATEQDASMQASIRASVIRRYSKMALVAAIVLVAAGLWMACLYTGSWSAVYGTAYGVVLTAKALLLLGVLAVGASNFVKIRVSIRAFSSDLQSLLLRIARATEVEIGMGFIILLAAASLTSQPPAVDLVQGRLSLPEIAARMSPRWPRLHTPPLSAMPSVQPMAQAIRNYDASLDVAGSTNNAVEQAWSEYNHHWAGIVVLAAGVLALLARSKKMPWARNWPLAFLGLAVFLFFRADPEAWPLGPRGFWQSFYNPEDLEHRLFVLLILSFVAFEWGVQTGRILSSKAALVFPAVCALGGALLLTHSHSLGNIREELLAEMSHTAIAVCAVFAGASRWLEVRLAGKMSCRATNRVAWIWSACRMIWPVCLILIGQILLDYREA
ncbi:MAG TPA: CopD family protein [Acidobacteriaceae bacterium]|nr:CopD family protein [Acidobacteriaceae bacterium]